MENIKEMNQRSAAMLGEAAMEKLASSRILIFGLGGVGGNAAESIVRSGIGKIMLIDSDVYSASDLNRQIFATAETIGERKIDAAKKRLLSISPDIEIDTRFLFWEKGKGDESIFDEADFVIDAIDTVSAKLDIIRICNEKNIPMISCMGTGNKLDPTAFKVSDIYKTKECPLARIIRTECKKMGIKALKVVYSEERPAKTVVSAANGRHSPASVAFVPGVAGMIMAGEAVKELIKDVHS